VPRLASKQREVPHARDRQRLGALVSIVVAAVMLQGREGALDALTGAYGVEQTWPRGARHLAARW